MLAFAFCFAALWALPASAWAQSGTTAADGSTASGNAGNAESQSATGNQSGDDQTNDDQNADLQSGDLPDGDTSNDSAVQKGVSPQTSKVWGGANYTISGSDKDPVDNIDDWTFSQDAALSFNFSTSSGLEILSELTLSLDPGAANTLDTAIRKLSIRFTPTDWLSVVAGKQALKWGTGKILAAIDKGEIRANPLDPAPLPDGIVGIKAEIIPTDWLSFSVLGMPETNLRWTQAAGRFDFTFADAGLDLGVGAMKYNYSPWKPESSLSTGAVLSAKPQVDEMDRLALSADAAWGIDDLTLYAEAELRWGRDYGYWFQGMSAAEDFGSASRDQAVFRGLAGAMLQLDIGLTRSLLVIGEYLYNGDGLSASEATDFRNRYTAWKGAGGTVALLPPAFYGIGAVRQHYAALSVSSLAIGRYFLASLTGIAGLDSGYIMVRAGLNVEFTQGTSMDIEWTHNDSFVDTPANEFLLMAGRNRLQLTVSTGY